MTLQEFVKRGSLSLLGLSEQAVSGGEAWLAVWFSLPLGRTQEKTAGSAAASNFFCVVSVNN